MELTSMDELRKIAKKRIDKENDEADEIETAIVKADEPTTEVAITDLSAADIKMRIDKNKSMEAQAEDVVGAMATARAVTDEKTAKEITEKKADELKAKASAKKKEAEAQVVKAETNKQEAERELYEAVLSDFALNKHYPKWLMKILVFILSPIFIVKSLVIGVPFGLVKTIMDNIDNVVCRYQKVDDKNKPKVRASIWILLTLLVVAGVCLTVLKCLNKI